MVEMMNKKLSSHSSLRQMHGCIGLLSLAFMALSVTSCAVFPAPMTPEERTKMSKQDQKDLFADQLLADHPISLPEAMARAVKYNLNHRTALLEKAATLTQADLSDFSLLPKIAAEAGYSSRDQVDASNSFSITDNKTSSSFATSSERQKSTAELTMVWNLLDFGVAAIQARQDWDRALISEELRRKTLQNLLRETRSTFWQAASAQKLANAIDPVIKEAQNAIEDARKVEQERLRPQVEILRFQRALMEIVRQLTDLRDQLVRAKTEFATLINLPPGSEFQLDIPQDSAMTVPELHMTVEEMEQVAVDNRPEMRESMYTARISADETRKALLRLLPGVEFSAATHYDSNSFLLNTQWQNAGVRVAWNLFNLLKGPTELRLAENQEQSVRMRRMALRMALLTQVHLARQHYFEQRRKLDDSEAISAIDQRILQNVATSVGAKAQSQLEHIHAQAASIVSRLQFFHAYAQTQNAVGQIFVTLGVDLDQESVATDSIPVLTEKFRIATQGWNEGIASQSWQLPPLFSTVAKTTKPDESATTQKGILIVPEPLLGPDSLMPSITEPGIASSTKSPNPPVEPQQGNRTQTLRPPFFPPPYAVQAASSQVRVNAEKLLGELAQKGYSPYLLQWMDNQKHTWFAVRIGSFQDVHKAQLLQQDLIKQKFSATLVPGNGT